MNWTPTSTKIVRLPDVRGFEATSQRIDFENFVLSETHHRPAQPLPQHSHELASMILTLKGSFRETIQGRVHECGPYSLFLRPAGEVHTNQYGTLGAKCLVIGIKPRRLQMNPSFAKLFHQTRFIRGEFSRFLIMRIYKEFHNMDDVSELAVEGLTLELLAHASRRTLENVAPRLPAWLEKTRELLHAHFSESLKLTEVAHSIGVHPVYMASMFHKHFHCTIGDYIRRLRVDFACRELTTTNTPLVEIGLAAGFCAQSHFSTSFKRQTGLTPTEYRQATRSN